MHYSCKLNEIGFLQVYLTRKISRIQPAPCHFNNPFLLINVHKQTWDIKKYGIIYLLAV